MPTTILDGETYEQARHRRFIEEAKVIEKMQQAEIIRMAREAGFTDYYPERLTRFAALVAAHERETTGKVSLKYMNQQVLAEREACAKVCDERESAYIKENEQYGCQEDAYYHGKSIGANDCAAAIRARGEK